MGKTAYESVKIKKSMMIVLSSGADSKWQMHKEIDETVSRKPKG